MLYSSPHYYAQVDCTDLVLIIDAHCHILPPSFIDRRDDIRDDLELASWLLEQASVATVPGSAFGAPGHLRLSFASGMEQIEEALSRIKKAINTTL